MNLSVKHTQHHLAGNNQWRLDAIEAGADVIEARRRLAAFTSMMLVCHLLIHVILAHKRRFMTVNPCSAGHRTFNDRLFCVTPMTVKTYGIAAT